MEKGIVYSEDVFQWLCYIIWKKRGCNNKRIIDYAGKDIQSYMSHPLKIILHHIVT